MYTHRMWLLIMYIVQVHTHVEVHCTCITTAAVQHATVAIRRHPAPGNMQLQTVLVGRLQH